MKVLLVQAQVITLALLGNKNYTTMKKYINLYALLAVVLLAGTACTDDLGKGTGSVKAEIVTGGEIVFGASVKSEKKNRTVYGETNVDKTLIEINWIAEHDRMHIASPQSVGMANGVAEYMVAESQDSETDGGDSEATSLERLGNAGLQWGVVEPGTEYDFYAVYPSMSQLAESSEIVKNKPESYGLSKDGVLTGYLPTDQTSMDVLANGNRWSIRPNMTYAYMVAKEAYTIPELDSEGNPLPDGEGNTPDVSIDLRFESLVTALQFELKAGDIGAQQSGYETEKLEILSVALFSQSGQQLAGDFEYDIKNFKGANDITKKGDTIYTQVIANFQNYPVSVTLTNDPSSAIDLTFFLLPSVVEKYKSGDLKLQVMYKVPNGMVQIKTATIGTDIPVRVKRYFSNVKLPAVDSNIDASTWFNALNPNVLVSQVSIPVAANTFANTSYGLSTSGTDVYRTQQTKTIADLWKLGVRGFEMVNRAHDNSETLGTMVAAEAQNSKAGKFAENFVILRKQQVSTFKYDENNVLLSGEPLVLICTYAAIAGGYDPNLYIEKLFATLDGLITSSSTDGTKLTADDFIQLTSNSTVGDIMGKVCIIIRPGDDERWAYENPFNEVYKNKTISTSELSPYGLTKSLPTVAATDSKWWGKVLMISDWGMDSWDSWHRRFGEKGYYYYATTATNYDFITNEVSSDSLKSTAKYEEVILGNAAVNSELTREYYYPHDMSNGKVAYVQDMTRVAEKEFKYNIKKVIDTNLIGQDKTLEFNVTWSESLSEKKKAIDGLFEQSVDTKGGTVDNNLYINNLSGYYITDSHEVSKYPAYYVGEKTWSGTFVEVFPGNSKGGNYKACADALTPYVYGILSGSSNLSNGKELAEGPWGLVMMDYIGTAEKSQDLVNLIMMNNFAGFRLAERQEDTTPKSAPEVKISDEKLNPEAPLLDWK